jgi:hypothetical protein
MKVRFGARSRGSLSSLKISRTFMQTGKTCAAHLIKLKRFQSPAFPDCPLNFAEIRSGPGGHCYCHLFSLLLRRNCGFAAQLSEFKNTANFQPALIEIEDALVPGFFVEQHTNDRCTVFVPSVPTPMAGAIYIIATSPSRVHRLNLPVIKVMQCISKCCSGSDALVAALDAKNGTSTEGGKTIVIGALTSFA